MWHTLKMEEENLEFFSGHHFGKLCIRSVYSYIK
jgi:hypothetical protein